MQLIIALEKRFKSEGTPHDLTLLFVGGPGDGPTRGITRLAEPGLLKRVVGGHYGLVPRIGQLTTEGKVEGYNLPLGWKQKCDTGAASSRSTLASAGCSHPPPAYAVRSIAYMRKIR
jgi:acyl CoA:acetate/3-ketoacid CoA transferase